MVLFDIGSRSHVSIAKLVKDCLEECIFKAKGKLNLVKILESLITIDMEKYNKTYINDNKNAFQLLLSGIETTEQISKRRIHLELVTKVHNLLDELEKYPEHVRRRVNKGLLFHSFSHIFFISRFIY